MLSTDHTSKNALAALHHEMSEINHYYKFSNRSILRRKFKLALRRRRDA
jgi:hypothetical protein